MRAIVAEVLADTRGLSAGAAGFALLLGCLIWLFGWRWHRFWVVFGITLAAGLVGLNAGQAAGGQVLAVGVLLAVAAGMLALEIARVLAFVAGGVAGWVAVQTLLPGARELWAVFLAGGLLGLLLYRLWAMLLTSLVGAIVAGHAALALLQTMGQFDAPAFATKNGVALNGVILVATIIGCFVQHRISILEAGKTGSDKSGKKKKKKKKDDDDDDEDEPETEATLPFWKRFAAG